MQRPLIRHIGVVWQLSYPTFLSASHSVNFNVLLALCPWYIRISISIWPQAGGPLCIPVIMVSATHQPEINRWDSPLWLYHLCPAGVNEVRFLLLQGRLCLVRERHDFLWSHSVLPMLPLFTYTLVHTLFSSLHSCSSSHSACPHGRGFTHVLSEARSYSAVPSVILLLIKPPSWVMVGVEALYFTVNISKGRACNMCT